MNALELIHSFKRATSRAGNPGLKRHDGLLSRKCWDGFIDPNGNILVSGFEYGGVKWVSATVWLENYLRDYTDNYGHSQYTIESQVTALASRLGAILAKNGVTVS